METLHCCLRRWRFIAVPIILTVGTKRPAFPAGSVKGGGRWRYTSERATHYKQRLTEMCSLEQPVKLKTMAEFLGLSERCVRDRIRAMPDDFWLNKGIVGEVKKEGTENGE